MSSITTTPQPASNVTPAVTREVQLLLWFSVRPDLAILPYLEQEGVACEVVDNQGLRLVLPEARLGPLVLGMAERLSVEEASTTKALRLPPDQAPQLADLAKVTTLRHLYLLHQTRWLQEIMNRDRLSSHFQPIVQASDTSRIFGYEALLRGQDPDGHPIPPLRLIKAARESGLLLELEQRAQGAALRGMMVHGVPKTVFININPTFVNGEDTSAIRETARMIDRLGIPRQQVVFEIIELDSIQDVESFGAAMREFQAEGFRFAIDDLGSGYSSLNLVHQLRPDFIKLDMALVRNVHLDRYKAVITQMVLELAQRLCIQTIAEGVEHLGELEWLRRYGVDYVQGYLIAKPSSPPAASTPAIGGSADGGSAVIPQAV